MLDQGLIHRIACGRALRHLRSRVAQVLQATARKGDLICRLGGEEFLVVALDIEPAGAFQLAERFGMQYMDSDGQKKFPVVIHRTSIGCYERTLALLIEKYAGALPTWMAPIQVKVLPITDRTADASVEIQKSLEQYGFRVETDLRNEKIGFKIREAQMQKVPYMLVIGDKEVESNTVSVRSRKDGDMGSMDVDAFVEKIAVEISSKV